VIFVRSEALRNARAESHNTAFSGGKLRLYTGPMPVAGEAITTQTLLFEADIPSPAGTVAAGEFEMETLEDTVLADGQVAFLRINNSSGNFVMDCDAGAASDPPQPTDPAAIVSPQQVYAGGSIRVRFKLIEL